MELLNNFKKWFNSQSVLVKAILLLIPAVGWICECLIRLAVALNKKDAVSIIVFCLFFFVGWGWILNVADFIYMLVTGHLFLAE